MLNQQECPICKSDTSAQPDYQRDVTFFICPVCGRFEYGTNDTRSLNENHLSSYLFYKAFYNNTQYVERRYHTTVIYTKTSCGTIKIKPGERKQVIKSNAEANAPILPEGDLYPTKECL